ncbi:MAG: Flp pilus assembly protein CpaB [Planctomycetaceae bacterium]|nr:Flp pilus assembly protein CpaB [Planctomycetaceae bacterium]
MKFLTPAFVTIAMLLVVGGLIVAYIAKNLFASEPPVAEVENRRVPLAVAELVPGTVITEQHIGLSPVPVDSIPPKTLLSREGLVGRVVKETIEAASMINSDSLYAPGVRPPLKVGEGMVAMTVSLAQRAEMVDGLIRPEEFVNVHMTPNQQTRDNRIEGGLTLTLFRGVKVVAMNRDTGAASIDGFRNDVTLELTPRQANVMILAEKRGDITLSYNPEGRGDGGVAGGTDERVTLNQILGLEPKPEPPKPFMTEHYRGSGRSELQFRDGRRSTGGGYGGGVDDFLRNGDPDSLIRTDQDLPAARQSGGSRRTDNLPSLPARLPGRTRAGRNAA